MAIFFRTFYFFRPQNFGSSIFFKDLYFLGLTRINPPRPETIVMLMLLLLLLLLLLQCCCCCCCCCEGW